MAAWEPIWQDLCAYVCETALLQSTKELLEWDERTMMPQRAGEYRAEQISILSGMIHHRQTSSRLGDWLARLAETPLTNDPHSDAGATIRQVRRDHERLSKVPAPLVKELARASVLGQQAFVRARKQGQFALVEPNLQHIVALKQQEAEAIGYEDTPYDALLDEFEPHVKTSHLSQIFSEVAEALVPLIHTISEAQRQAPTQILRRHYPESQQRRFGRQVAELIGFDFSRGRLDVTDHPFCAGMGPDDCRITTRYDERFFSSAFFGILHEAGHGIYEQGLRTEQYGLPPGTFTSLGIHESQSRLWENFVGRSGAFWLHCYPIAQQFFRVALGDASVDDFLFAINEVRPSLIRVDADEATYNLHIVIRFEIEQALIRGDLRVGDLPSAWNAKYRQYLDITPLDDRQGVLQDIHWSAGLFGYFPTYSLGNLYAAQFIDQAKSELDDLDESFSRGEFGTLRQWLREQIHQHGQRYTPEELVEKVTGGPLSHRPLIDHLYRKLGPLYGFS
jgi:carboxypeptidase Taq